MGHFIILLESQLDISTLFSQEFSLLLPNTGVNGTMVRYCVEHFEPHMLEECPYVEPHLVFNSVKQRQIEHLAGRYCSNRALQTLFNTERSFLIGKGRHGQPLWPSSVVGSIAHSQDWAVAIVSQHAKWLGIDCEDIMTMETAQQISTMIAQPNELSLLSKCDLPFNYLLSLLFSAKESIYKAIYPQIEKILDFNVVSINKFDLENNFMKFKFSVELQKILNGVEEITVSYFFVEDSICTYVHELN